MLSEKLKNIVGENNIFADEPMRGHTTFRIGGNAKYYVIAENADCLTALLRLCREEKVPNYILGNGSNLLVRDEGYDGVMIRLGGVFREIEVLNGKLCAGGGAILANVAMAAAKEELTGLEFAFGIPGSVGGAMVMNAGAYGGEMKQVVESVQILEEDLTIREYSCEEMQFGYRDSILKHKKGVVLSVTFVLTDGNKDEIQSRMDELTVQRKEKQPLEYPSAGSTFKRPEGYFAGKLIQDAGCKGYRVGGAMVSEKHAGFVVNVDHATAADVIAVITDVSRIVKEQSGVTLEPEVIIL